MKGLENILYMYEHNKSQMLFTAKEPYFERWSHHIYTFNKQNQRAQTQQNQKKTNW